MNNKQLTENGGWHLRKDFTLGTLIVVVSMFISGYISLKTDHADFYGHINLPTHDEAEQRLDALEARMAITEAVLPRIELRMQEIVTEVQALRAEQVNGLQRIEDRLNKHDENGR